MSQLLSNLAVSFLSTSCLECSPPSRNSAQCTSLALRRARGAFALAVSPRSFVVAAAQPWRRGQAGVGEPDDERRLSFQQGGRQTLENGITFNEIEVGNNVNIWRGVFIALSSKCGLPRENVTRISGSRATVCRGGGFSTSDWLLRR
jgi:hypothetical protein